MVTSAWVFLALLALSNGQDQFATVQVQEGLVRGYLTSSIGGTAYYSFQGIPYALPPVGDLRFTEAQPMTSWEGERDATADAAHCVQIDEDTGGVDGQEDCLYLNVYTTELEPDELKPVMVWIHGGAFQMGNAGKAQYGPDFLIEQDIVIASIAYRVDLFGFMSLEDATLPGNLGLKDQVVALQWVRNNIASFGGDPEAITIFGHSAGSTSVALNVMSPLTAGLFVGAISQSGAPVGPIAFARDARVKAFRLGALLGFDTDDSQQLLDFLRTVDAADLINNGTLVTTQEEQVSMSGIAWLPIVEPDLPGAFLTAAPEDLVRSGDFNQVRFMTGVTTADGNYFLDSSGLFEDAAVLQRLNDNFTAVIGPDLRGADTPEQQEFLSSLVREFYFGTDATISNTTEDVASASTMLTDIYFAEPTDSFLHLLANATSQPLYYYEFAYRGPGARLPQYPGVSHGDEIRLEFLQDDYTPDMDPDSEEATVRIRWVEMLTNFAKNGNPTPDQGTWESFNDVSTYFLLVNVTDTLQQNKDEERMEFWRRYMPL